MKGVKVNFFKDIFQLFKDLNKNKKGWRSFYRTWNIDWREVDINNRFSKAALCQVNVFYLFTKQATLNKRYTLLSLPLYWVFLGHILTGCWWCCRWWRYHKTIHFENLEWLSLLELISFFIIALSIGPSTVSLSWFQMRLFWMEIFGWWVFKNFNK
jgi:hypothetical protein